ncbi:MAG: cytochrome P450, partial [Actinomycetota bacterium]
METFTVNTYEDARDVYRQKDLRQALYDAGEIVMGGVLVNLHGDEHRARRRLENRLFRRETLVRYERDYFPRIIDDTLAPHVEHGSVELVHLSHQLMMNLAALNAGVDRPL